MLYFQTASAGSGKTYKLTEKFVRLLLSAPDAEGRRVLIPAARFSATHPMVLAITFTNKAAQEMKDRIIDALSALAHDAPGTYTKYLATFMEEFDAGEQAIRDTAACALDELLNNYTDFNVSTIDAFFQRVLRSFAYETDLNTNFRLEVKNNVVNAIAVESMLSNHKGISSGDDKVGKWIESYVKYAASRGAGYNAYSPKSGFIGGINDFLRLTSSEDFSKNEGALKDFFNSRENFYEEYMQFLKEVESRLESLLHSVKLQAATLGEILDGLENSKKGAVRSAALKYVAALSALPLNKKYTNKLYNSEEVLNKAGKEEFGAVAEADTLAETIAAYNRLIDLRALYHKYMPAMAIYGVIDANRRAYCDENNIFLLSDTNPLLRDIISDSDAPFIYEKIGSFVEHFLIDEFQDTSENQWDIIRPLFDESLSNGQFNMIIGDAKQSIYRFRNADPTIISEKVPEGYKQRLDIHGLSSDENSNYRSLPHVVEFNNTLFSLLSSEEAFAADYVSVVQRPRVKYKGGYVECRGIRDKNKLYADIPEIIASLVDRGYPLKDICILARKNFHLRDVTKAIDDYNLEHPHSLQLRYISNEALLVNSSKSVRMAVAVLRILAGGTVVDIDTGGGRRIMKYTGATLASLVNYVLMTDESVTTLQEALSAVSALIKPDEELADMLGSMTAMTLPALVENVLKRFVPAERLTAEAQYVSAFLDKVVEWSDHYGSAITPFLRMWDEVAPSLSVISPDGTDAVKLMTIHKSKGLQFRAVIFLTYDMDHRFMSHFYPKRWVAPAADYDRNGVLPERVIAELTNGDIHPAEYDKAFNELKSDNVNLAYVACTRAEDELYILFSAPSESGKKKKKEASDVANSIGDSISSALGKMADGSTIPEFGIDSRFFKAPEEETGAEAEKAGDNEEELEEDIVFAYGELPAQMLEKEESNDRVMMPVDVKDFHINTDLAILKYREEDLRADDEDDDPRSIGNLMHLVMSRINTVEDLPRALKILTTRGLASDSLVQEISRELSEVLDSNIGKKWFRKGLRVINERTIIGRYSGDEKGKEKYKRPDRIIVDRRGNATVIDFKFGSAERGNKYRNQVRDYMERLRQTGLFSTVKGYLWYVKLRTIEEVK